MLWQLTSNVRTLAKDQPATAHWHQLIGLAQHSHRHEQRPYNNIVHMDKEVVSAVATGAGNLGIFRENASCLARSWRVVQGVAMHLQYTRVIWLHTIQKKITYNPGRNLPRYLM
jgi:hypothetical protein